MKRLVVVLLMCPVLVLASAVCVTFFGWASFPFEVPCARYVLSSYAVFKGAQN